MSVRDALADHGSGVEMRVLLASLHVDRSRLANSGVESLTPQQWDRLVTLAGQQRVRPLVLQRLHEAGSWRLAPAEVWQRLTSESRAIAARKMRMHTELSQIVSALSAASIPTIVLKGAHLGPVVYQNVGLREMNDLDVLVTRPQLEAAVTTLGDLGYEKSFPFSVDQTAAFCHDLAPLTKPGAASVEIHWNLTSPNLATSIDPQSLWNRARPARHGAAQELMLSPVDLLLHLGAHASFQHQFEFGLRPSCDLQRVIAHFGDQIDWDDVVCTAAQREWSRGVALSLALARELVGAAVPDHALKAFASDPNVLRLARALTLAAPDEPGAFYAGLAELASPSWPTRIRVVRNRIFVPKAVLLACYKQHSGTRWWRWLYARRVVDLLTQYSWISIKLLLVADSSAEALARRRIEMRKWLETR